MRFDRVAYTCNDPVRFSVHEIAEGGSFPDDDPNAFAVAERTTIDVIDALREQNIQVAAGQIGGSPSPKDQPFEYSITTLGRLETPDNPFDPAGGIEVAPPP